MTEVRLKVWSIIFWGYSYTFQNLRTVYSVGVGAIILTIFYLSVVIPLFIDYESNEFAEIVTSIFAILVVTYFAVGWHRTILLDEKARILRLRAAEIKYFLIILSFASLERGFSQLGGLSELYVFLIDAFIIIAFICVLPLLPGIAIDDETISIKKIWNGISQNRFRFFFASFVSTILYLVGFFLLRSAMVELSPIIMRKFSEYGLNGYENEFTAELLISFIFVFFFFPLLACLFSSLSAMYVGIAKQVLSCDSSYKLRKSFAEKFQV